MEISRVKAILKKEFKAQKVDVKKIKVFLEEAKIKLHKVHIPAYIYERKFGEFTNLKIVNA